MQILKEDVMSVSGEKLTWAGMSNFGRVGTNDLPPQNCKNKQTL